MAWNYYPGLTPEEVEALTGDSGKAPPRLHAHADMDVLTILFTREGEGGRLQLGWAAAAGLQLGCCAGAALKCRTPHAALGAAAPLAARHLRCLLPSPSTALHLRFHLTAPHAAAAGQSGLEIAPGNEVEDLSLIEDVGNIWNGVPIAREWTPLDSR